MNGSIELSRRAANGLSCLGCGEIGPSEEPERMAWVLLVAKARGDNERIFPNGKWAMIQHIEGQLDEAVARLTAATEATSS